MKYKARSASLPPGSGTGLTTFTVLKLVGVLTRCTKISTEPTKCQSLVWQPRPSLPPCFLTSAVLQPHQKTRPLTPARETTKAQFIGIATRGVGDKKGQERGGGYPTSAIDRLRQQLTFETASATVGAIACRRRHSGLPFSLYLNAGRFLGYRKRSPMGTARSCCRRKKSRNPSMMRVLNHQHSVEWNGNMSPSQTRKGPHTTTERRLERYQGERSKTTVY
jgi:hypothetical protein